MPNFDVWGKSHMILFEGITFLQAFWLSSLNFEKKET